jgi:hypothetical protein
MFMTIEARVQKGTGGARSTRAARSVRSLNYLPAFKSFQFSIALNQRK